MLAIFGNRFVHSSLNYNYDEPIDKTSRDDSTLPPARSCVSEKMIIDSIFLNYTKHKLPTVDGVKVEVDIWVQEITSVSEISSDFEIDIYINELWFDPALRFDHMM